MSKLMNVKGHPGLVKDKNSGAILNINNNEITRAKQRKKAWKEEKERSNQLEADVSNLKNDISEIKDLLRNILEVKNGNHND